MISPGRESSCTVRYFVWARSGARVESDYHKTLEDAIADMRRDYWSGRDTVIVQEEVHEDVVVWRDDYIKAFPEAGQ